MVLSTTPYIEAKEGDITTMQQLLSSRLPIVAAPMAGGPSSVELARAVSDAGAFPFLAAGYRQPKMLHEQIAQLRSFTENFGVNVFVPTTSTVDTDELANYAQQLQPDLAAYGLTSNLDSPSGDDYWHEKIELLLADPVPVVSFTFGLPDKSIIHDLHNVGTTVLATVTTPNEAELAESIGVDGLVVQGPQAGGHSATFNPEREIRDCSTIDVVRSVLSTTSLPLIATGGVDSPQMIRLLIDAGAQAVAVGTLLLRTHEAGTSLVYREALANPAFTDTVMTKAFTGRPARSLRNDFIDRHPQAPCAYPIINHLTLEMRKAAAKAGDPHRLSLWAGTGWREARSEPAAQTIARLASLL
ncbi:nitronate monooxygenase [Arcanobacterium haemolyticum]|nr:nitronate monooxygenase [Arcanobacterium haemolyticum]